MSTFPSFCGKAVNPAPILGLAPPSGGPPHGPPSGTAGYLFCLAHPPSSSDPPSYPGPPFPSPSGPPIPPSSGPPTPSGFPTPPTGPPVGVSSGSAPFLNGIDRCKHHVNPTELEDNVVASASTIQPWTFANPEVGSTVNNGVCFKTFVCTCNIYMQAIAAQCLGTETMSLKSFLCGFPKLTKLVTKADIFDFLSSVTCYCMGCSVYVPPPHTMI